jgi:transcription termination/antitermination protein NusA
VQPAADLLSVAGVDEELAYRLAAAGVITRDDLADLATDELIEKVPMDEDTAAKLIMVARGVDSHQA